MLESLLTFEALVAFLTLTSLEIVLGIDNIVFISILVQRLPEKLRPRALRMGLIGAMMMRLVLLFAIKWLMGLTEPLFSLFEHAFSLKDLILICGGLFLIGKSTHEIHIKLEDEPHTKKVLPTKDVAKGAIILILVQIMALDAIFSIDSVITAIGMAPDMMAVMVAAIVVAIGVMLLSARSISRFVEKHPTIKMLALAFLILIGVLLTAEGLGQHINKGYIYFAMAFSLGVELLNMKVRANRRPVRLHEKARPEDYPV